MSCVIKHLTLVDALQSLVNYQYREEHAEEYDLVCKIMAETFKKINAMERQLQVKLMSNMLPSQSVIVLSICIFSLMLFEMKAVAQKCKAAIKIKIFFNCTHAKMSPYGCRE